MKRLSVAALCLIAIVPAAAIAQQKEGVQAEAADSQPEISDDEAMQILAKMLSGESFVEGAELEEAIEAAQAYPLGSNENPVRTTAPQGERRYLAALRCPDGRRPNFERRGSGGAGPYGNIVDFYSVTCNGQEPSTVVMDMYHGGYIESDPIPGFTIKADW